MRWGALHEADDRALAANAPAEMGDIAENQG